MKINLIILFSFFYFIIVNIVKINSEIFDEERTKHISYGAMNGDRIPCPVGHPCPLPLVPGNPGK
ncbi:hypothetical protein Mgra_00007347 [Meloidogyne graminicola]|uniref:Uncharacterized protein n=1 Tax=Meloidogyne graminicola TaxID=189291 RepID=A0A8S9ZIW8_9BILA|nr:hypothetical protein Mgra_00007347 [Meloidogyne graminicola]